MKAPNTKLSIDGSYVKTFEEIILKQEINDHHSFTVTVDYDSIETQGTYTLEKSREWLGKIVTISFDNADFVGVITNVKLKHDNGYEGKLLLSGFSKTILLEQGEHLQSWLQAPLKAIIDDCLQIANIISEVNPVYTDPITYQTQYQENHFQFIQRLAKQYNEWLYYDGVKLIFGKPKNLPQPITIEYGADMDTIDIAIAAIPSTQTHFSYHALDDKQLTTKATGEVRGLNELGFHAFKTSKSLFPSEANGYTSPRVQDMSGMETLAQSKQGSKLAKANMLSGTSTKQGLSVGTVIKVTAAQWGIDAFDIKKHGEYIITKIEHKATGSKEYTNSFEAISSGVQFLPEPEVALPIAQQQIATVLSNDDPKQKGRVQVQFQWQERSPMKTSWLRVMTPDAGSSDTHAQNRGHVFIPEVGDQVMVGFRYNDPNRPFVMGSLFNGITGAGGKEKNSIKSIITRSGHTIEFNDTEKAESITITDRKGNHLIIDTAGENISINALKDITINAGENLNINAGKNININAGENIDKTAGQNITTSAGKDIVLNAVNNMRETSNNREDIIENNFNRQSTFSDEFASEVSLFSAQENMTIKSSKTVEINSAEKSNLF